MIRIALFDMGETLIHGGVPFPGVVEALTSIAQFEAADGAAVGLGIVSDFHIPGPPITPEQVSDLEEQYREEILAPSGLARFFDPFESRVTISSRAGVSKPDRQIFELAVARMNIGATLRECLFVTETLAHLKKCEEYGMTPIRFGPPTSGMASFVDWIDAPGVLAEIITPERAVNLAVASASKVAAQHGLIDFTVTDRQGCQVRGHASQLFQLNDPRLGPLDGVFIERPSEVTIDWGADGKVAHVAATDPDAEEVADAVNFVSSLIKSGRVAVPGQSKPAFGATHAVETDAEGRPRLVRCRYAHR